MYWLLGILGILGFLIIRRRFSARARVRKFVVAAQQGLERRDLRSFDQNLQRSKQIAEKLRGEKLRLEFRGDLALMGVQGAYWLGDIAGAELAAHGAIETLESIDPADSRGKLCSAHVFLGDILLDTDRAAQAAEQFRAAAGLAAEGSAPFASIFPLQRLADALLEEEKREDATSVIERCVEIEREFFASQLAGKGQSPGISMMAPDLSLARGDFAMAEKLLEEKVRHFASSAANSTGIDVLRYQLHLAGAQQAQGQVGKARATLISACATAEKRFGPQHPRVARVRRRIEALPEVPMSVGGK
jgi:hypothetical protein